MKSVTINSGVIYLLTAIAFVAYCYLSYMVFTASNSPSLIEGDKYATLKKFFSDIGLLSVITPVLIVFLLILIIFTS